MPTKVITVRIDAEEARRAEFVARAEGSSVNEVFRQALLHYFELKWADTEFVARAKAMVAHDAELAGALE